MRLNQACFVIGYSMEVKNFNFPAKERPIIIIRKPATANKTALDKGVTSQREPK